VPQMAFEGPRLSWGFSHQTHPVQPNPRLREQGSVQRQFVIPQHGRACDRWLAGCGYKPSGVALLMYPPVRPCISVYWKQCFHSRIAHMSLKVLMDGRPGQIIVA